MNPRPPRLSNDIAVPKRQNIRRVPWTPLSCKPPRPTELLITNPEHDNITHACRALYVNETSRSPVLLNGSQIRRIVYGATGRNTETGSGWNAGFFRQVGRFWEPIPLPIEVKPTTSMSGFLTERGHEVFRLLPRGYAHVLEREDGFERFTYDAENFNNGLVSAPRGIEYRNQFEPVFIQDPGAEGRRFAHNVVRDAEYQHEELDAYLDYDPYEWYEMWEQAHGAEGAYAIITVSNEEWRQRYKDQDPIDVWMALLDTAANEQASREVKAYRDSRVWWRFKKADFYVNTQTKIAIALEEGDLHLNEVFRLADLADSNGSDLNDIGFALHEMIDERTKSHASITEIDVVFRKVWEQEGMGGAEFAFDFDALDVKGPITR